MVITSDEVVARWAAKSIDLGRGQMVLRPLVIGPGQIPRMLELADAQRHRDRVERCDDLEQLAAWLGRAATVDDPDQLFDE